MNTTYLQLHLHTYLPQIISVGLRINWLKSGERHGKTEAQAYQTVLPPRRNLRVAEHQGRQLQTCHQGALLTATEERGMRRWGQGGCTGFFAPPALCYLPEHCHRRMWEIRIGTTKAMRKPLNVFILFSLIDKKHRGNILSKWRFGGSLPISN